MKEYKKLIRKNIREVMDAKNINQVKLSELMKMTQANVSRIMTGKVPLSENHIDSMSEILAVKPELFFKDIYPNVVTNISGIKIDTEINATMGLIIGELVRKPPEEAKKLLNAFLTMIVT